MNADESIDSLLTDQRDRRDRRSGETCCGKHANAFTCVAEGGESDDRVVIAEATPMKHDHIAVFVGVAHAFDRLGHSGGAAGLEEGGPCESHAAVVPPVPCAGT